MFCLHGLVGYDVRWLGASKIPIVNITLLLRYIKLLKSTNNVPWKMHLSCDVFCLHGLVGYDVRWLVATKIPIGNVNLTLLHNKFMKPQTFRVWKSTCRRMCSVFTEWLVMMLDDWMPGKYTSEILICCWDTPNCTKAKTILLKDALVVECVLSSWIGWLWWWMIGCHENTNRKCYFAVEIHQIAQMHKHSVMQNAIVVGYVLPSWISWLWCKMIGFRENTYRKC